MDRGKFGLSIATHREEVETHFAMRAGMILHFAGIKEHH
jgi:hypothetical protein